MCVRESRISVSAKSSRLGGSQASGIHGIGEFRFILHRFPINVIGLAGLLFLVNCVARRSGMLHKLLLQQHFTTVHTTISVSARPYENPAAE